MKRLIPLLLVLIMLCACGREAEETTSPETAWEVTEPATVETAPPTSVSPTTAETEPTTEPAPDESWFDDALFIGESRTAGLQGYGRLGKADYFCGEGLTVYGEHIPEYDCQHANI